MGSPMKMSLIFIACSLFFKGYLAEVICENLPENLCAFGISSSGKRCVLENYKNEASGSLDYTCQTSEIVAETFSGHIESDSCVAACGLDRRLVGISSDALLSPEFTATLCSPACYQNCPNIVDLYFNLAAGEGVFLPALCKKQNSSPRRAALELLSSGGGGTPFTVDDGLAPSPAPATICHLSLFSSSPGCSGPAIELGCACKDDLAAAHKHCADTWFKIRGNKTCEICNSIAENVAGPTIDFDFAQEDSESSIDGTEESGQSNAGVRRCLNGHRLLNILLGCLVFAFAISWLLHFNIPS
ncbi:PAR1 protein [Striga hermonthica]|uniref:PAR1 protein n=1 Tax=Striga hermonthica TaxID=68872 RepID=A0A9N7NIV5_STRHE|nr:PAR1 protein [Striga hermonthica]